MKALCIGQSAYNIMAVSSEFPLENTKNKFEQIEEGSTGCAANMAYLLGKYGAETYIGSVVGDDTFGSIVRKDLERVGVHTEYMETAYDKRTALSFSILGQKNTSRTIYDVTKEPLFLKKTEFQMDPDVVIVDGYDYGASLAALNKFSSKITIIDAGMYNPEIMELCKSVKYIVSSKEFAEAVTGGRINFDNPQSLVSVFSQMVNKFPGKEVVVTLEDKGAMYMSGNQIKVMPGLNLKPVDPTGAGDIFHAAFAYALGEGYDMERCITFANIAGGLCVTKIGALQSTPDLSDIMTYFNQKYGDNTAQTTENVAPVETVQETVAPAPTTEAPSAPETPQTAPAVASPAPAEQAAVPVQPTVQVTPTAPVQPVPAGNPAPAIAPVAPATTAPQVAPVTPEVMPAPAPATPVPQAAANTSNDGTNPPIA